MIKYTDTRYIDPFKNVGASNIFYDYWQRPFAFCLPCLCVRGAIIVILSFCKCPALNIIDGAI